MTGFYAVERVQKTALLNFCTPPEYMSDCASVSHREHRGLHREHRDFMCKAKTEFRQDLTTFRKLSNPVSLCPLWFFILCVLCGKAKNRCA